MTLEFKSHTGLKGKRKTATGSSAVNGPAQGKAPSRTDLERAYKEQLHEDEKGQSRESGQLCETQRPKEIGGPSGPEPTRYGDWERNGICSDF